MRILLILLLITIPRLCVLAETCFTTFKGDSARADIIFVGKLYKISEDEFWHRGNAQTVFNFEVHESFKGLKTYQKYVSIIGPGYNCCNVHFIQDSVYLVFAYGDGKNSSTYYTSDCSLTGLLSESNEYYERLGESIIPTANAVDQELLNRRDKTNERNQKLITTLTAEVKAKDDQKKTLIFVIGLLVLIIVGLAFKIIRKNST
ncbi:hypothetical protein [Cesiribacter sp. SM1]|uniref:hypothetical protein n=1 Tax=Cesiribacter sp. SM1 TaxID=2861196 RepID=UPI001CD65F70|nr:hypothetical protein [Cesiribacter sp. SM1]